MQQALERRVGQQGTVEAEALYLFKLLNKLLLGNCRAWRCQGRGNGGEAVLR